VLVARQTTIVWAVCLPGDTSILVGVNPHCYPGPLLIARNISTDSKRRSRAINTELFISALDLLN
jgi:hypothetical protein